MEYYVLASGSKGNCSLVVSKDTKILIDCGCSKKYIRESLMKIGYTIEQLDALLLTHSHSDHIRSVEMFADVPVYAPFEVMNRRDEIDVVPYQSFQIGTFTICPLPLSHDAGPTVGYVFKDEHEKLVYVTDTGYFNEQNISYVENANYYIFESNHDIPTLMATNRPQFLKARILSNYGHLCNEDAAAILSRIMGENTTEVVLAHISQEANTQKLAYDCFVQELHLVGFPIQQLKIHAAGQFELYYGGQVKQQMIG